MNIFEFLLTVLSLPIIMQFMSLSLLGFLLFYLMKSRKQRIKDEHDIVELRRDLRALTAAALGVGVRVLKVERQQNKGNAKLNSVVSFTENTHSSYDNTLDLVQQGADINDLVNNNGLSQGEAELVNLLHRINDLDNKKSYKSKF